jgi:hypothetical protein
VKELHSIRFLFDKSDNKETHFEYEQGKNYSSLGLCSKIVEHTEGDHYELTFQGLNLTTMNIFCKTRVITKS